MRIIRVLSSSLLMLLLVLAAPMAFAQETARAARPDRPRIGRLIARSFERRIVRGVRAGRVSPEERAALRARIAALRAQAQALRQTDRPPDAAERRQLREQIRRLNREIFRANHDAPAVQ